jgi:hypothetical protein
MANLRRRIPQQTESLFTENHEPFFNSIGHKETFPVAWSTPKSGVCRSYLTDWPDTGATLRKTHPRQSLTGNSYRQGFVTLHEI